MLRASERRGCDVCTVSYDQPGAPIPPTGDAIWVGVRCQFQCRACGHLSPLNHLDVDGSVACLRCGIEQMFDNTAWVDGLDHAMRCGALAGQSGKFKQLGITMTAADFAQNQIKISSGLVTSSSLQISAGPGHPPCPRCHWPLDIEIDGTTTKARCSKCDATQACELAAPAKKLCSPVCGVIAEELLERREAKVDDSAGALAIKCAHCAAPLKVTGMSTIVTCEYCGSSSRIPRRTMFKLGHDKPVQQLWWLAFSRTGAAAVLRQRERPEPKPRAPQPTPHPPRPATTKPEPPKSHGLAVLGALGVVVGVGLIGYREDFSRWRAAIRSLPSASGSGSAAPPRAEPPAEPRASTRSAEAVPFVELAGCTCGPTRLLAEVDHQGASTSVRLRADRNKAQLDLDVFELGADVGIGVGCENDRVVIAAGPRVAAWSLDRKTKVWDRVLSAPYKGDTAKTLRCIALKVRAGRITIPTTSGTTVLKMLNGQ